MYESHFSLARRPFAAAPDPDGFVPVETARQALAELLVCIRTGQGIGVLTAPAGTGKTLLCRRLAAELQPEHAVVFLANAHFPTPRSLLQAVLYELGHPYLRMDEPELRLELVTLLRSLHSQGRPAVLILDEAHLLDDRVLLELRAATNLVDEGDPLLQVVLCGDVELDERLADPALQALNQRVGCQVTLEPLTRAESAEYLRARVAWAGGDLDDLFAPEAVELICHASDGLPRCLNQLADHTLLLAYVAEEKPVGEATVREALDDLKQLPLQWNDPVPLPAVRSGGMDESQPEDQGAEGSSLKEDATVSEEGMEVVEVGAVEPDGETERPAEGEQSGCIEWEEINLPAEPDPWHIDESAEAPTGHASPLGSPAEIAIVTSQDAWAAGEGTSEDACATADVFQEELVFDRYALLDAGLPLPSEPLMAAPADEVAPAEAASMEPVGSGEWSSTTKGGRGDEALREDARPDRTIDGILPLLEEALATCGGPMPSDIEIGSVPDDEQSQLVADSFVLEEDEIESRIGAEVLETCLEMQQALADRLPNAGEDQRPTTAGDEMCGLEGDEETGVWTIVPERGEPTAWIEILPESAETAVQLSTDDLHPTPRPSRRRPYEQLFSDLRRRQRQAGC